MEQIRCTNCNEISEISPKQRCTNCNYPLFPKDPPSGGVIGGGAGTPPPLPTEQSDEANTTAVTEDVVAQAVSGGSAGAVDRGNGEDSDATTSGVEFEHHENTVEDKQGVDIKAGWLIIHMPDRDTTTFDLYLGKNVVGRPTANNDVDIPIDNDDYVSRKHMVILVEKDDSERLVCSLFDDGRESNGRPSTNGTFINGSEQRVGPTDEVVLNNNDSIQVGETVVVFRSVYEDLEVTDAATAVMDMDFIKAIAIK